MTDLVIQDKIKQYNKKIEDAEKYHKRAIIDSEKMDAEVKRVQKNEVDYWEDQERSYESNYNSAVAWINDYRRSGWFYRARKSSEFSWKKKSRDSYNNHLNNTIRPNIKKGEDKVAGMKPDLLSAQQEVNKADIELKRIKTCKDTIVYSIPKAELLLKTTELKLAEIKKKAEECRQKYSKTCNNNNSRMLTDFQEQRSNHNSIIHGLEESYAIEKCNTTKHCKDELKSSNLAETNYISAYSDFKQSNFKYEDCNDAYRNNCRDLLMDIQKSQGKIGDNITYMKATIESMVNISDNIALNNELDNTLQTNDDMRKNLRLREIPMGDSNLLVDKEMCKNILLTSAGSVMLYYLFFEN